MKWITASLLNLDCLDLSTSSFWLYVISRMSQSPLQRTPLSVCQRKFVWDAFTKILFMHFFRSRMSAGDQSSVEFDNRLRAPRPILSLVEDAKALYLSSQRAVALRCDFVNDDFSTSGSTAQPFDEGSARCFPVSPHAPHPAGASPLPPVFSPYSTDQKWTVALLKVLDDMNAPDYAFHAILTWARAAIADGFSFQPAPRVARRAAGLWSDCMQ